ncbi:MFS transporter [Curtobacterium sp. MCBA15_004]|uniref:MFS transporter n=1 Tax=Curtobacterium sp. MCBA15_004 TaxID=1898733 RepID=UPI0008DD5092|nr:MFS transporter [Curtobacterium sp. MCBA15_004]WIA96221.1 MFS transporter [Curtobacterium sp. MCBA15_004]
MKRSFLFSDRVLIGSGLGLIAATYGLVRLAYGLFLPDVQRDLGFGADVAGAVSAGGSVLYCVGAVAGSVLAGRAARALAAVAALIAGVGALVMAASTSTLVFGTAAVVASAGAGIASPALVRLVGDRVEHAALPRAQAVVNSGTGPGLVAAGVLALVLLPDWRTAWTTAGILTLVVGGVLVSAAGSARDTAGRGPSTGPAGPDRWWLVAHALPMAVALAFGAGSAVVWTYGRTALVEAGVGSALSVGAWVALGAGGALVAVTARWTSPPPARRQWALTAAVAGAAVLVLGLAPAVVPVSLAACAVFGWGYTAATGALIAWTTEVDRTRAPVGTSALFVLLVAGQALGAAVAGTVLGTLGTAGTFVAAAAVVLAAALVPVVAGRTALRRPVATRGHEAR